VGIAARGATSSVTHGFGGAGGQPLPDTDSVRRRDITRRARKGFFARPARAKTKTFLGDWAPSSSGSNIDARRVVALLVLK